jgi:hypothetical protein
LYCLKVSLVPRAQQQLSQEAFIAAIDIETVRELAILVLPNYRDVMMSMSPDGVALMFDQTLTRLANINTELRSDRGEAIVNANLWLLPIPEIKKITAKVKPPEVLPKELNYSGFKPKWIP